MDVLYLTESYRLALNKLQENLPLHVRVNRLDKAIKFLKREYEEICHQRCLAQYQLSSFKDFHNQDLFLSIYHRCCEQDTCNTFIVAGESNTGKTQSIISHLSACQLKYFVISTGQ